MQTELISKITNEKKEYALKREFTKNTYLIKSCQILINMHHTRSDQVTLGGKVIRDKLGPYSVFYIETSKIRLCTITQNWISLVQNYLDN